MKVNIKKKSYILYFGKLTNFTQKWEWIFILSESKILRLKQQFYVNRLSKYKQRREMLMSKFVKRVLLLLTLFVVVSGLASCAPEEDFTGGGTPTDENAIYSPGTETVLVLGDGVDKSQVENIRITYKKLVGKEIVVSPASSVAAPHEIVVGKADRDVSNRAYRLLALMNYGEDEGGYVIYSDGKSVALAFDGPVFGVNAAITEAVDIFVKSLMTGNTLKLSEGTVARSSFDVIEWQTKRDEATVETLWELKNSQILAMVENKTQLASAIIEQLKGIRKIYAEDDGIVTWLANLYDPVSGGFYFSNSARNNEGFMPDLESTAQAIGIVESILTGYSGTLTNYFGEEIAAKFVRFVKEMQAENGYFYHPQWTKDNIDKNHDKRSRDVMNAISILESFGASPTYDTPTGVKGDGILSDETAVPASRLTTPLSRSRVAAVSAISGDDEIYIPPHLKSKEALETYLSTVGIYDDTYEAGEAIMSQVPLIVKVDEMNAEAGESLCLADVLTTWLAGYQNSSTGMWASRSIVDYDTIKGFYSIVRVYTALGRTVKNTVSAVDSIYSCLTSEQKEHEDIVALSDTWTAIAALANNLRQNSIAQNSGISGSIALSNMYAMMPDMLSSTYELLNKFVKLDGSFSTYPDMGASESHGMPIAAPNTEEGDMNATLLATKNIYLGIFNALGVGSVPIFNTSDRMVFQKTLKDLGIIIKNEIIVHDPIDFNDETVGEPSGQIKVTSPAGTGSTKVLYDSEERGNVVEVYSASNKSSVDQFFFNNSQKVNSPSCLIYEVDMCVLDESSENTFTNLYIFQDTYMIALNRQGDTIRFFEESSRSSGYSFTQDIGVRAKVGEWFNLRVEYYVGTASTVRIKIYFNDECVAVTDNYFGTAKYEGVGIPSSAFNAFAIYGLKDKAAKLLIDNVLVEKSYKIYAPETSDTLNKNIDTPDKPQKLYSFDTENVGAIPDSFKISGNLTNCVISADSDGNLGLKVANGAGKVILPLDQRGAGVNSAVVSLDLTVGADSAAGATYEFAFNEYMYLERTFAGIRVVVKEENGTRYATLAESSGGKTGTTYSNVKFSLGVKYSLKLVFFFNEAAVVVLVDNEIAGINTNVTSRVDRYYMGEIALTALAPDITSSIFVDNLVCERVKNDFAEMTSPDIDRVVYPFDSLDGVESQGVRPSEGVLSFESVLGGGAYIKVPVNVRVPVPTMAVVSLDIQKLETALGTLSFSFTDKAGNIVAIFDLVSTSSGINIYEYTENGRYKTPIGTISKTAFSLVIEHSEAKQGFNFRVGDEYVASSSVNYTAESGAYSFDYLKISTIAAAGFSIDNLYIEKISDVFKVPTYAGNIDNNSETITFEQSSFASMPSKVSVGLSSAESYCKIRERSVKGEVSKVLEIKSAIGTGYDTVTVARTKTVAGANAAYFETDICLLSDGTKFSLVFEFVGSGRASYFRLDAPLNGNVVAYGGISGKDFVKSLDVKEGEWFRIRLEYTDTPYDFNYDGNIDVITKAYVNGEFVGMGYSPYYQDSIQPGASVNQLRMMVNANQTGGYCIDNAVMGQHTITYDAPIPPDTDTITFEPGVITDKTKPTLGSLNSTAKISEMTVAGEVTRVLQLITAQNSTDYISIKPTVTLDTANAISFETDLMIKPTSDVAEFTLEPTNSGGIKPFVLTIKAYKGGNVTVSSKDIAETVIGKSGEWIHLKAEYMNPRIDYDGDKVYDILYKIYVGGSDTAVATGYKPYTQGGYYDPKILTTYKLTAPAATVADICLDNTRFWQVELTPDEAPEVEEPEIGEGGVGDEDSFGWS